MGFSHYKDHTIVNSGFLNEHTGTFVPTAAVTWQQRDGGLGVYILTDYLGQFPSYTRAALVALEAAKTWVDYHAPSSLL
jgi:hypothetical protein